MSDTPEMDALDGELSDYDWDEGYGKLLERACKLERERDEARKICGVLRSKDNKWRDSNNALILERDQFRKTLAIEQEQHNRTVAIACGRKNEIDQLRKVSDELAKAMTDFYLHGWTNESRDNSSDALRAYNSLPHVIESRK